MLLLGINTEKATYVELAREAFRIEKRDARFNYRLAEGKSSASWLE